MYRLFLRLSQAMAVLGGLALTAVIALTCVSIAGRSLSGVLHDAAAGSLAPGLAEHLLEAGIGPVPGDFELVEAGVAFAIFAFLPLCQLTGGHASVDIFTARLPARASRVLQMTIDVVFALVLGLIAVQLGDGMLSKMRSGQTTFLLQFPVWWAYALSLTGAVAAAAVGAYVAVVRVREAVTGRTILPSGQDAGP